MTGPVEEYTETNITPQNKEQLIEKFGGPVFYDVLIDEYRAVTQKDVDRWLDFIDLHGSFTYQFKELRKKWASEDQGEATVREMAAMGVDYSHSQAAQQ